MLLPQFRKKKRGCTYTVFGMYFLRRTPRLRSLGASTAAIRSNSRFCSTASSALVPRTTSHWDLSLSHGNSKSTSSDVLQNFCGNALPILLSHSNVPAVQVAAASRILSNALTEVDNACRASGLRHESAFPAALAAALWNTMPSHVATAKTAGGTVWRDVRAARRSLALRTREVSQSFTPDDLADVLMAMERAGALSDDILGPTITEFLRRHFGPAQWGLTGQLTNSTSKAIFSTASALAFLRLLGRAQLPAHFQMHRFVHATLLPALSVSLSTEVLPGKDALLELTACFTRYSVGGSAATQLMTLWQPLLGELNAQDTATLLRFLTSACEEYLPLMEGALLRTAMLCSTPSSLSTGELVMLFCALAKANAVGWADAYTGMATAMLAKLNELSTMDVARITWALMGRNSHIPFHPLHELLAQRLCSAREALSEVKIANAALLAAALMAPSLLSSFEQNSHNRIASSQKVEASQQDKLQDVTWREHAFAVFRRHGTRLGLRGFVAGMCTVPLAQLPPRSQERVVAHFTSIVSAIEVSWLARGIGVLVSQIPSSVDNVSVARWFSRFAAKDVSQQLDLEQAILLLSVLSNENYARDSALAKRAILSQVGHLLMREDLPLESIGPLSNALQKGNVFFPHLYSRVCRALLANAPMAPWCLILPAFGAAADYSGQSKGSVFRDVWDILRRRLMDEVGASLTVDDTIAALNAFAALDPGDRPLFAVLTQRLWTHCEFVEAPSAWADEVFSRCSPSALATVTVTLLRVGKSNVAEKMSPWVLLRLRPLTSDLYPADVLQLMPTLLDGFASAALEEGKEREERGDLGKPDWMRDGRHRALLHAVYDGCRSLFLQMYEQEETAADVSTLQAQREEWTGKVRVSVARVPRVLFAQVLIALSRCGVRDEQVATAAATRLTRRVCGTLAVSDLVDLTLAMCFHFPPNEISDKVEPKRDESEVHPARHKRFMPPVLDSVWERTEELYPSHVDALVRCLRHYYGKSVDVDFMERLEKHKASLAAREQACCEQMKVEQKEAVESSPKTEEGKRGEAFSTNTATTFEKVELWPDDLFTE